MSSGSAAGHVLTSDAAGNGTWQPVNGGGGWSLTGNAGTDPAINFLGTTDNQPLELKVNNARVLRLEPHPGGANLVGGHPSNSIAAGVYGAVISGGGHLSFPNRVESRASAIGGGSGNVIRSDAVSSTIAGGGVNIIGAEAAYSTIAGGFTNVIQGQAAFSTVGGGAFKHSVLSNAA